MVHAKSQRHTSGGDDHGTADAPGSVEPGGGDGRTVFRDAPRHPQTVEHIHLLRVQRDSDKKNCSAIQARGAAAAGDR
jgi:hypothetical protein